MKLPKLVAIILIIGLSLQGAAYSKFPAMSGAAPDNTPANTNRGNPLSVMQGEQSIDPFTVHPANRWRSETSGSFSESLVSGELQFVGSETNSSMYRYREASTADDTIAARWRLNATVEITEAGMADYAITNGSWGTDGWSFVDSVDEFSGLVDGYYSDSQYIATVAGGSYDWLNGPYPLGSLDAAITDRLVMRIKTNDSTLTVYPANTLGNPIGVTVTNITSSYTIYNWSIGTNANWTGSQPQVIFYIDEDDGTLEGDEGVWIDYVKIMQVVEFIGHDFEIPLIGLNATTSEGIGNTTLSAYLWNSTHYIIRPTMTTGDGSNYRSWNIESTYQDFAQVSGDWGADGWEFIEGGLESFTGNGTESNPGLGYLRSVHTDTISLSNDDLNIDADSFPYLILKIRSNDTITTVQVKDWSGGDEVGLESGLEINETWEEITFDLGNDTDWAGIEQGISIVFTFNATPAYVDIDYILITTTNITSSLTFFEYDTYYRADLDFDLRRSELGFTLRNDLDTRIVKEDIGEFRIAGFFDDDELIPDIFTAQVGDIDYLLGIRTKGVNTTINWDYYEAEFVSFYFKHISTVENSDSWEAIGPYAAHNIADSGGSTDIATIFQLTVPEFDSANGRLTAEDTVDVPNVIGVIKFIIYSVDTDDGDMHLEATIVMSTETTMSLTYAQSGTPGQLNIDVSDGRTGYRSLTFSIFNDKQLNVLSVQLVGKDAANLEKRGAASWTPTGDSNEIVFQIKYEVFSEAQNAEEILILEDWTLTFRDLFGLPIDLPSIDDVAGGIFDIILWPIIAILNAIGKIPSLIVDMIGGLGYILSQLTSIEGVLGLVMDGIVFAVDLVTSAVDLVETAVRAVITAVQNLADLVWTGLMEVLEDIVDAILLLLGIVWGAIVDFIRDITIQDVNVGDVLDAIFAYLGFFTLTAGTTLEFIVMILVEWGTMLMVFLFLAIIFVSIASSNAPGEVLGRIASAYTTNTMPFSIFGFRMHVPLIAWNLPFILIVVLGIV